MFSTQYVALEDMWPNLQQYETCTIAKAMGWVHIPKEHQGATKFDMEVGKGKARDIEGVEIFNGIIFLVAFDFVNTDQCELISRKLPQNSRIEVIHSIILGREDGALQEILVRFAFSISNMRIDGVDEGLHCVLREAHAGGESDRGIWAQMKSSTHFKQPLGKSIALWSAIKAHILLEVKECGGLPEVRVTKGGTDNLLS